MRVRTAPDSSVMAYVKITNKDTREWHAYFTIPDLANIVQVDEKEMFKQAAQIAEIDPLLAKLAGGKNNLFVSFDNLHKITEHYWNAAKSKQAVEQLKAGIIKIVKQLNPDYGEFCETKNTPPPPLPSEKEEEILKIVSTQEEFLEAFKTLATAYRVETLATALYLNSEAFIADRREELIRHKEKRKAELIHEVEEEEKHRIRRLLQDEEKVERLRMEEELLAHRKKRQREWEERLKSSKAAKPAKLESRIFDPVLFLGGEN